MTPEQKAATEALHEAILNVRRVFGYEDDFFVTEWIVLTAETKFDSDGDELSAYTRLYNNGNMPHHRSLGLMNVHTELVKRLFLTPDE